VKRPRHTKPDRNQSVLIIQLRTLGAVVWDLHDLVGTLDLLVCWYGRCIPVEVKAPGCEADFTDNERATWAALEAVGVKPVVASDLDDVLRAFGAEWGH